MRLSLSDHCLLRTGSGVYTLPEVSDMTRTFLLRQIVIAAVLLLPLSFQVMAKDFDDYTISHIDYPDWFKETFYDLDDDIAEAGEEGKKGLMILFTTEGCSYCARFIDVSLGDPEAFYDFSNGYEDIAIVTAEDAGYLDELEPGIVGAPLVLPEDTVATQDGGTAYYPSLTAYYIAAYEDMFPYRGDYDFNDLVVGYRVLCHDKPPSVVRADDYETATAI